ncbi:GNAT family N-acetyltransferase [Enterococcus faecalis]
MLTIKKTTQLTEKELETIMAIWLQTNLEAHPFVAPTYWQENKAFVRTALPKATLILAEEEDQIIGFLGLMDNYIAGIFIKKAFQGKGIGQKLLQVAKEEQDLLSLAVYRKNQAAYAFYQKQGFVQQKLTISYTVKGVIFTHEIHILFHLRSGATTVVLQGVDEKKRKIKTKLEETQHGSNFYETITRSRRTLWSPNSSLEPKNEEIYLHRKKRYLHH